MNEELVEITLSCRACWRKASLLLLLLCVMCCMLYIMMTFQSLRNFSHFQSSLSIAPKLWDLGGGRTSRNGLQQQARKRRTCLFLTALGGFRVQDLRANWYGLGRIVGGRGFRVWG